MSPQIHTYAELRQQIHRDLRIQHPEWVQPNGESPCAILTKGALCSYSARRYGGNLTSLSLLSIAQSNVDEIESTSRRVMQPAPQ
jgi:hypothetical protein